MPKLWFLDHLCKTVSKSRIRAVCAQMELSATETRLVLERFCDRKTLEQCDFLPERQQKDLLPFLDAKVAGWFEANVAFFTPSEWRQVIRSLNRGDDRRNGA